MKHRKRKDPAEQAMKVDFAAFILEILLYLPRFAGRFLRNL
ncbi:hypothetical protein [Alteribacter natronophilus]|nr:hypothetical protein [Alteribacter natronophilus]